MNEKIDVIAIDGPSGAGKSTVAKAVAAKLGWSYLDTGAMYRAVGLKADRLGVSFEDDSALERLCADTRITFTPQGQVMLDGEDVSTLIREHRVSDLASRISARKPVRAAMGSFQRAIGEATPTVAEGRDMGTVIFPDARLKVFLTADAPTRAKRRTLELESRGQTPDYQAILADIEERDKNDSTRALAPLKAADDATPLDTSGLGVDEVVAQIAAMV